MTQLEHNYSLGPHLVHYGPRLGPVNYSMKSTRSTWSTIFLILLVIKIEKKNIYSGGFHP
jgi:hypothetical protein